MIADISTCNPSPLRELGVRRALRPCTTILDERRRLLVPAPIEMIGAR